MDPHCGILQQQALTTDLRSQRIHQHYPSVPPPVPSRPSQSTPVVILGLGERNSTPPPLLHAPRPSHTQGSKPRPRTITIARAQANTYAPLLLPVRLCCPHPAWYSDRSTQHCVCNLASKCALAYHREPHCSSCRSSVDQSPTPAVRLSCVMTLTNSAGAFSIELKR